MSRTLWITGATGFVGSHLVYRLLKHTETRIVAIVRDRTGESARRRLLATLEQVAWSYREIFDPEAAALRLEVVSGDITQTSCGVDLSRFAAVAGEPTAGDEVELWHIAASLKFEDRHRDEIRLQNVTGTQHALALAEQLDAARFVYISTAYTCGRFTGEVAEELHSLEREFNNVYEQTKCAAEHEVHEWSLRTSRKVAIVRPSIVVGPERTYQPGGSDTGLYGFARETARLKPMLEAAPTKLVMLGDADAQVNLIPVDVFVTELCGLANADFRGGLVHHITSSDSPSVESLLAIVGKECGAGPIGVLRERSEQASPVEQLMDRRATFYASYLRAPKTFARRAGAGVSVSNEDLTRFVRAFVRLSRKETADAVFDRELVRSPHSPALVSYAVGDADKPALVLCNAYGIPADVWVPLASALKREYRILTWELRAHDGEDCGPDLHATDLKRVLNHHGITSCYVAGFCTGADVALRFAELYPRRALGVISVAGALNMMHGPETTFQRDMRKLAKSAAHDLARAQLYHQLLFGQRHDELGAQTEGARSTEAWLGSMVGELDPSVLHLTSAPFRDADTLHDYAKTMHDHYAHSERTSLSRLELPALFITGTRDTVSHPEPSRLAAAQMADATLLELNEADHFAVYSETAVMGAVRDFINRVERGLAREPAYLMACAS